MRAGRLPSYRDEYVPLAAGSTVVTTVDACTVHGCFNLVHEDAQQLERDYEAAQGQVAAGRAAADDVMPDEVVAPPPANGARRSSELPPQLEDDEAAGGVAGGKGKKKGAKEGGGAAEDAATGDRGEEHGHDARAPGRMMLPPAPHGSRRRVPARRWRFRP